MTISKIALNLFLVIGCPLISSAQDETGTVYTIGDLLESETSDESAAVTPRDPIIPIQSVDSLAMMADSLAIAADSLMVRPLEPDTTIFVDDLMFPDIFYMPAVFDKYDITRASAPSIKRNFSDIEALRWVERLNERNRQTRVMQQQYMIAYPEQVRYNTAMLPEPPKEYHAVVDPTSATITIEEVIYDRSQVTDGAKPVELKRKNWLHSFNGSVQFSQAYNSPNWYQGGNNNLNMIANAVWTVKLNQAFHPDIMFENTVQYRLAMNSAPDDSLRNYSISEDRFQINTKFGIKAARRWYYSVTMMFKTQLLNNYHKNTENLAAAFLSPGELNLGLGMTYNYATKDGKLKLDVSMAPLSYNMKMCTNKRMHVTDFGIKEGHKTVSQYGSNAEGKLTWKPAYNITYTSRLYLFSNYSYLQGDWENTVSFEINRFLTTQIYVHLRYDSSTAKLPDTNWHTWQLKEILSFGFAYKFSTAG